MLFVQSRARGCLHSYTKAGAYRPARSSAHASPSACQQPRSFPGRKDRAPRCSVLHGKRALLSPLPARPRRTHTPRLPIQGESATPRLPPQNIVPQQADTERFKKVLTAPAPACCPYAPTVPAAVASIPVVSHPSPPPLSAAQRDSQAILADLSGSAGAVVVAGAVALEEGEGEGEGRMEAAAEGAPARSHGLGGEGEGRVAILLYCSRRERKRGRRRAEDEGRAQEEKRARAPGFRGLAEVADRPTLSRLIGGQNFRKS